MWYDLFNFYYYYKADIVLGLRYNYTIDIMQITQKH